MDACKSVYICLNCKTTVEIEQNDHGEIILRFAAFGLLVLSLICIAHIFVLISLGAGVQSLETRYYYFLSELLSEWF